MTLRTALFPHLGGSTYGFSLLFVQGLSHRVVPPVPDFAVSSVAMKWVEGS